MKNQRTFTWLKALGCTLMLCGVTLAQTVTGTLEGLVTDQTGAVIPGATVTVRNLETGHYGNELRAAQRAIFDALRVLAPVV